MRAVIEERVAQGAAANTLYQGCRAAAKDQHYGAEFRALADAQKLVYRVAASRDGPPGVARTYVQHLIEQDQERVWELVGVRGAWVYISGCVLALWAVNEGSKADSVVGRQTRCPRRCVWRSAARWRSTGRWARKRRRSTLRLWKGREGSSRIAGIRLLVFGYLCSPSFQGMSCLSRSRAACVCGYESAGNVLQNVLAVFTTSHWSSSDMALRMLDRSSERTSSCRLKTMQSPAGRALVADSSESSVSSSETVSPASRCRGDRAESETGSSWRTAISLGRVSSIRVAFFSHVGQSVPVLAELCSR